MGIWQDLLGTTSESLRLTPLGVRLKNLAGSLLIRNAGDTEDASLTAAQINLGSSNSLQLRKNPNQSGELTIIYPAAKATDGQVLAQKAGTPPNVIEFEMVDAANTASANKIDSTLVQFGSTSPIPMFNLPADSVVALVEVIVDEPFNGTPSLSIGVAGQASKYLGASQVDLTAPATTVFQVRPGRPATPSQEPLIASYSAGGATAGSARILIYYGVPA